MNKIAYVIKILGLGLLGFSALVGYSILAAWNNWFLIPLALALIVTIGFTIDVLVLRNKP